MSGRGWADSARSRRRP